MILVSRCFVKWQKNPQNQTEYSLSFHLCAILPLVNANVFPKEVEVNSEYHTPHTYPFMVFLVLALDVDLTLVHKPYVEHVIYKCSYFHTSKFQI